MKMKDWMLNGLLLGTLLVWAVVVAGCQKSDIDRGKAKATGAIEHTEATVKQKAGEAKADVERTTEDLKRSLRKTGSYRPLGREIVTLVSSPDRASQQRGLDLLASRSKPASRDPLPHKAACAACPFDNEFTRWTGEIRYVNGKTYYVKTCIRGHLTLADSPD